VLDEKDDEVQSLALSAFASFGGVTHSVIKHGGRWVHLEFVHKVAHDIQLVELGSAVESVFRKICQKKENEYNTSASAKKGTADQVCDGQSI